MKWQIFRELDQLTLMASEYECEHEYQYWKFISDDFKWVFPLYAREGTELFEIVKEFTRDDMVEFGYYLENKEYATIVLHEDDTLNERYEKVRQFSENVLSDFVFGIGKDVI